MVSECRSWLSAPYCHPLPPASRVGRRALLPLLPRTPDTPHKTGLYARFSLVAGLTVRPAPRAFLRANSGKTEQPSARFGSLRHYLSGVARRASEYLLKTPSALP